MHDHDVRPDPDALMLAAAREGKGHLKVFLGAAPGVGKTWEMLASSRRLLGEGRDVLIGVVETHGRAGTQQMIGNLPILPRRSVAYRGQVLEEFDVDAALARKPGLLLVDELAHTNAPGSRHNKRWEDVAELLEAGIDVWATLNVQHLESLNDDVARITGVRVTETLPDRVMEMADEIEFIDISPSELRSRLKEGHIYRPEVAARALENFFREGNLAALREIGLRRAAQRVDQDVRDYMRAHAVAGPWPAGDRVLALAGSDQGAEVVIRQAKRLADALRAPWLVLHMERPDGVEAHNPALEMAASLGAEIEIRAGGQLVAAALELARKKNVTHLVIGRGRPSIFRRFFGTTLAGTLVRQGPDFSLHVVPVGATQAASRRRPTVLPRAWLPWAGSTFMVALVAAAGKLFPAWLQHEALGMLFLAAVVGAATLGGLAVALYAAALSYLVWDVLFLPPIGRLSIQNPRDVVGLLVFAGVASATGWLASRVRREATVAQGRIESLRKISAFARRLGEPASEADLFGVIAHLAADTVSPALVLVAEGEDLSIRGAEPPSIDTMDDGSWAAARWAVARQEQAGRGTATLPSAAWRFLPLRTARKNFGVLGVRPASGLDQPAAQTLASLADQAASALERVRLTASAARAEVQEETQKLRTALLRSLSHDLRTPLTGIRGAAGSLRTAWDTLSVADRTDLLESIEQDIVRMTRFLANITEMTRLETGDIAPLLEALDVREAVEGASLRVPGLAGLLLEIPPGVPKIRADPALFEQVLVNILENAAKYASVGSPVMVTARKSGRDILVSIADSGPGISMVDLPHIFDSFYRARLGDRTIPGTGLGLAIARGLVEAMGGTIEALSPRPGAPSSGAPGTSIELRMRAAGD
jgi:two-component system sensor histidine kinase KdpD